MLLRMHIQPQGMAHHIKVDTVRVYVLLADTQRNYQDKAEKGTAHGRYLPQAMTKLRKSAMWRATEKPIKSSFLGHLIRLRWWRAAQAAIAEK